MEISCKIGGSTRNYAKQPATLAKRRSEYDSIADFNWRTCYGLGPKLQKLVYSDNPREQVLDKNGNIIGGKVVDRLDIHAGEEYDWCQRSDISMY